ncbi:MAG: ribonuclease HII [Desulfobulbus propionicus]|nr:MAG: ribonuclease HII [Desulfobulbus propionicus]
MSSCGEGWDGSPTFFEHALSLQGYTAVGGVDEAGRGPLAGPVVAACVVFSAQCEPSGYMDSKLLSPRQRAALYEQLMASKASYGIGMADAGEIDQINILQASLLAMLRAVNDCTAIAPDFLLVDGKFKVPHTLPQISLVQGEQKSISIAAASIVAKVTRDRLMAAYHRQYPCYGFISNQGYPTKAHRAAIAEYGPSPIHRMSFKGVREYDPQKNQAGRCQQTSLW